MSGDLSKRDPRYNLHVLVAMHLSWCRAPGADERYRNYFQPRHAPLTDEQRSARDANNLSE